MRKIKIDGAGNVLDAKDNILLLCPMKGGDVPINNACKSRCTWFRTEDEPLNSNGTEKPYEDKTAFCGDKVIGKIMQDERGIE
jgi:hypothetical protein